MSIPLKYAYICADRGCDTITDIRRGHTCSVCGFHLTVPLSRWINRAPSADDLAVQRLRQTWARGRRV